MTADVEVRRARFQDAEPIARFVNRARADTEIIDRMAVAERFSDVGFLLAEHDGQIVGILGWQVENLVVRVTDFLVAPAVDRVIAGKALITAMEEEASLLQAEVSILFLPPHPSEELVEFWGLFGYSRRPISDLNRNWREVAREWSSRASEVMIKQLREGLVMRPM